MKKPDEQSIMKIFLNDVKKDKLVLSRKFHTRARKLLANKAISKETYRTILTTMGISL